MTTEHHNNTGGTLTLTAEGKVQADPDIATINLGVVTEAKTAQAAVDKNSELMTQVNDRIKALALPDAELKTTGFSISPVVDSQDSSPTFGKIVNYRAENTLRVKAPVAEVGKILDEGVAAGANVAGQLLFQVSKETAYQHQAVGAAVKSGYADAEFLAHAMGGTLRGTPDVDLQYGGEPILFRGLMASAKIPTPIEPGTVTISAIVRMTFKYDKAGGRSNKR
jgi:uncharacterized protein YggE